MNIILYSQYLPLNNGTDITVLDYVDYITTKKLNIQIIFENTRNLSKNLYLPNYTNLFREYDLSKIRITRNIKQINCDILLLTSRDLLWFVRNSYKLNVQKIFVFDSVELTMFLRGIKPYSKTIKKFLVSKNTFFQYLDENQLTDKITFLITPYNMNDMIKHNLHYKIYYKKINMNVLSNFLNKVRIDNQTTLSCICSKLIDDITAFRKKYPNVLFYNRYFEIWKHRTHIYVNKKYVNYLEQFGRHVLESKYFGYEIIIDDMFKKEPKTNLDYYLQYIGQDIRKIDIFEYQNEISEIIHNEKT